MHRLLAIAARGQWADDGFRGPRFMKALAATLSRRCHCEAAYTKRTLAATDRCDQRARQPHTGRISSDRWNPSAAANGGLVRIFTAGR